MRSSQSRTPTMNGIPLSHLEENRFHFVDPDLTDRPARTVPVHRKLQRHEAEIREHYVLPSQETLPFADAFDFWGLQHRLPARYFDVFSFEELARLQYSTPIGLSFSSRFRWLECSHPADAVFWKIHVSHYKWSGSTKRNWNRLVTDYQGLHKLSWNRKDFEVTLDVACGENPYGPGSSSRTYLDGTFGLLVHYRSRHVLTVGFSFIPEQGILLNQVQTRNPRGNRWIFHHDRSLVDHALDRLQTAYPDHTLFLVEGNSLVRTILDNYSPGDDRRPNEHEQERIRRFYDQSLTGYERVPETWQAKGAETRNLHFFPLRPRLNLKNTRGKSQAAPESVCAAP